MTAFSLKISILRTKFKCYIPVFNTIWTKVEAMKHSLINQSRTIFAKDPVLLLARLFTNQELGFLKILNNKTLDLVQAWVKTQTKLTKE
jgi:hypothetical protein